MPATAYVARVLCPMSGPPLAEGAVLVEGSRITEVGAATALASRADRVHEVDGVLLPGLVDGHSHLELADAVALAVPGPAHVHGVAVRGLVAGWDADTWSRSARRGVQALLRGGATAVADVVHTGPAVPAAVRSGLVGDSHVAVSGVDAEYADEALAGVRHALALPAEGRRVGVAPDPARCSIGVLRGLADLAREAGAPLHVHAGGSQAELAAIRDADGPLADAARADGLELEWLDAPTRATAVRFLDSCGLLGRSTTVVGGVYVDDLEVRTITERGARLVLCPQADVTLRAGDAPVERLAEHGTLLALGTASQAAVATPDLLAEAAAFVALAGRRGLVFWPSSVGPVPLEEQAVRLVTIGGARALGWDAASGVLEAGRRADLVGVALETSVATVYRDLVEQGAGRQVLTVLGGVRVARREDPETAWPEVDRERH